MYQQFEMDKRYLKAVTFSFDDGNESDIKLVELLNKYNLKCSFNLNSGLIGKEDNWLYKDKFMVRKLNPFREELYEGHEVCVHGLLHRGAPGLTDEELYEEFHQDKVNLEERFGYEIKGSAYAYGAYDDRTIEMLQKIGIRYCRTVESTWDFKPQRDMYRYKATGHFQDKDIFDKIEAFLNSSSDAPRILYIWGHSYEGDGDDAWDRLEKIFRMVSGREDVLYGTNTQVFEYFEMI
ncbi:MAG: polysaccharide deacetylase family protein [Wujia sp.]